MKGDIILEIGDSKIGSIAEYEDAIAKLEADEPVLVLVRKRRGTRFLTLQPGEVSE